MSGFAGSPRTLRGALVTVPATGSLAQAVVFQYNPDAVSRSLKPRAAPSEQHVGPADAHRVWGAPVETITMSVELDATDQLEVVDPVAARSGIAPQLAALELLLYPPSSLVVMNAALLQLGTIEILPAEGPLTLLVWGPGGAVPVRLDGLTISEQAFSPSLSPLRASVDLSLQVLSYNDLPVSDPGHALFLAHQVVKEALATQAGRVSVPMTTAATASGLAVG
ncbi:hypothetical protein [Cellulomonas sp. ICMP 17802]|uniref:hypothetical protein n=1 Tax=Cellulomonas sp. ICMP 17802 TaxID=3239199 RepID=UPI00351AFE84